MLHLMQLHNKQKSVPLSVQLCFAGGPIVAETVFLLCSYEKQCTFVMIV